MSSPKFPSFNNVSAAANIFDSEEFGDSQVLSLQVDDTNVVSPGGASWSIMGSNISTDEADMIALAGGSSIGLAVAFEKQYFPYKYIGVKYVAGGASGSISIYINKKQQAVKLC